MAELNAFYALVSTTCFTLVGLWWIVVQRHTSWRTDPLRRRLAGGTYLSFLLPGLMAMFAQVAPGTPLLWRVSFGLAALIGVYSTTSLLVAERRAGVQGPFRRFRWVVILLYVLVFVLGVAPELVAPTGLRPLQVGSLLLITLIVLAHGLTWEFMMDPDEDSGATVLGDDRSSGKEDG